MLDGPATMYYESSVTMSEAFYFSGVIRGKTIYYHENGKFERQTEYNLDVLDGKSIEWTKNSIVTN